MNTNKHTTAKTSYRITNWSAYNQALAARGSLTIWVEEAVLLAWQQVPHSGLPGHPVVYPDQLMLLLGTLKELYRLPLRQTMGFVASIWQLCGLAGVALPDYTTLQRRLQKLAVPLRYRRPAASTSRSVVLLVDSTGIKVSGEGEWKVRLHGIGKRRLWRKLHIAQDSVTWEITGMVVSDSIVNDDIAVPSLLEQAVPNGNLSVLIGDGAYDKRPVYKAVQAHGGQVLAPPNKAAILHTKDPVLARRNAAIAEIAATSLAVWKERSNYHRRSLVETTMFRFKRAFGDTSLTNTDSSQYTQFALRVRLLNYFTSLGLPAYGP